jgi:hypothetical protein
MRLLVRLQAKYGRTSAEFRTAWKFFKAGYAAALDDFLDATTPGHENHHWYNDEPTLQAVRRKLGLRRSTRR